MIPRKWPDVTKLALEYLRTQVTGVTFTRTKTNDAKCVVLDVEPLGLETPITRRFTVLLEAWVTRSNGEAHPAESYKLMDDVLFALQSWDKPVRFDTVIGPRVVKDAAGVEYHEGSIVLVFA